MWGIKDDELYERLWGPLRKPCWPTLMNARN